MYKYRNTHTNAEVLTGGQTLVRCTEARARRFPRHLFTDMRSNIIIIIIITIMTHDVSSSTFYPKIYRNLSSAGYFFYPFRFAYT